MTTTKAAHTPGPWSMIKGAAEGDQMRCAVVVERGKTQYLLATIENGAPGDFCETEEANARLIAAAPELLAALKKMREAEIGIYGIAEPILIAADEAIAKATGA